MEGYNDYKLPDEDESYFEINDGKFNLQGWLKTFHEDMGIDMKDPLRGSVIGIQACPGEKVIASCSLTLAYNNSIIWKNNAQENPMFIYEAWGQAEPYQIGYSNKIYSTGCRLLAHKKQLGAYLQKTNVDLLVEVNIERSEQNNDQRTGPEKTPTRGIFDRIYKLQRYGELKVTEECLGTWQSSCS